MFVGATDGPSAQAAIDKINAIANPQLPKIGERFLGTVVKTTDFGAFVSLLPGRDGLVHISKLGRGKRIAKVEDVVKVGDKLRVEIADIDNRGKISLVLVSEDDDAAAARVLIRLSMPRQAANAHAGLRRVRRGNESATEHSAPHHPARWSARRHRIHPVGALGVRRCLGGCRFARRRRRASPAPRTSWSTCCSSPPRRAARWTSPRRSTPSAVS